MTEASAKRRSSGSPTKLIVINSPSRTGVLVVTERAVLERELKLPDRTRMGMPSAPGGAPGQKIDVPISIKRLYKYADQVRLTLGRLPRGVGGISGRNATIDRGKNQTKLLLQAAANATPGKHELTLRTTCRFNNQNLVSDHKFVVTVQKK